MKKLLNFLLITILSIVFSITAFAQTPTPSPPNAPNNSDSVNISKDDLKVFRQAVADKVYFEARAKQFESDYAGCQNISENWKKLYSAEKDRADNIQGSRINKLEGIISEKNKRIENYIVQSNQFRDENLILSNENNKLKKQRWKIGAISFGVGLGVGGVAGNRL